MTFSAAAARAAVAVAKVELTAATLKGQLQWQDALINHAVKATLEFQRLPACEAKHTAKKQQLSGIRIDDLLVIVTNWLCSFAALAQQLQSILCVFVVFAQRCCPTLYLYMRPGSTETTEEQKAIKWKQKN
jgi:hypothetical protein